MANQHILINGLSMGSGGGYTVGIELFRHIALARPDWKIELLSNVVDWRKSGGNLFDSVFEFDSCQYIRD